MKFLKPFLVVLLVMIPVTAFAEKANTIEELAAMYDSSSCKECHAEITHNGKTPINDLA